MKLRMIVIVGLFVVLSGCAAVKPTRYVNVQNPNELSIVQSIKSGEERLNPIKMAVYYGVYKKVTPEQFQLALEINAALRQEFQQCKSIVVSDEEKVDSAEYIEVQGGNDEHHS